MTSDLIVGLIFGGFFGFFSGIAFTFWGAIWFVKALGRLTVRLQKWGEKLRDVKNDVERAQDAVRPQARDDVRQIR